MLLPVMAGRAHINDGGLLEKKNVIGSMRFVAGGADPFLDRLMLCDGLLLPLDSIVMASAAESEHGGIQQPFLG